MEAVWLYPSEIWIPGATLVTFKRVLLLSINNFSKRAKFTICLHSSNSFGTLFWIVNISWNLLHWYKCRVNELITINMIRIFRKYDTSEIWLPCTLVEICLNTTLVNITWYVLHADASVSLFMDFFVGYLHHTRAHSRHPLLNKFNIYKVGHNEHV